MFLEDMIAVVCLTSVFVSSGSVCLEPSSRNQYSDRLGTAKILDVVRGGRAGSASARISHSKNTVTLTCDGDEGLKHIDWWFYKCLNGSFSTKIYLTQATMAKQRQHFQILTSRTGGSVSSSLQIRNVEEVEVAGLYRCDALPFIREKRLNQTEAVVHYFIVGGRKALQKCVPGSTRTDASASILKAVRNLQEFASNITYEYLLRLPYALNKTHDYKIRFSGGDRFLDTNDLRIIKFGAADAVVRPFFVDSNDINNAEFHGITSNRNMLH